MKILILQKPSDDGCTWYRLTQFAKEANKQGLADVQFLNLGMTEEDLQKVLSEADLFIGRLNPELDWIMDLIKKYNKPIVIDIDDSIDDISPYSQHYRKLGTKEVKIGVDYLWQDGKAGFSLEENKKRVEAYRNILRKATSVITTTHHLKSYIEQYNENVGIVPNCIDPELFPVLDFKGKKQINILWSGGASHFSDMWEVKPVLDEIMNEYPQVHFYMVGTHFPAVTKDMPKDRVHTSGWIKPDGHGYRLACLNADIGICPIQDTPFNQLKSSIKYYELSALGVVTVARGIPPYSDDILDGETGFLYNTDEEMYLQLKKLIEDPILRIKTAENALQSVKKRRNLADITKDWISYLKGISDAYK